MNYCEAVPRSVWSNWRMRPPWVSVTARPAEQGGTVSSVVCVCGESSRAHVLLLLTILILIMEANKESLIRTNNVFLNK